MKSDYSVLMSVYYKEKPEHVDEAIRSMINQTVATNDFVIVCDGPLTKEINDVIEKYVATNINIFNIIRLPKNVGIGAAAEIGLKACKNSLVAKMDADDISIPERCEMQLKKFDNNKELAVIGGYIAEFEDNPNEVISIRTVPKTNKEIRKFARKRQPFNNVTVMYKKEAVVSVGGYKPLRRCEDYNLYIRLLKENYYVENIEKVLVKVRVDKKARKRRASLETLKGCVQSRWFAYRCGYSSFFDFIYCCIGGAFICICPNKMQQIIYEKLFRKNNSTGEHNGDQHGKTY